MILHALTRYYDILADQELVPPYGYSVERIAYVIYLSSNGEILSLIPLENNPSMVLPENVDRSADVDPNFLYDTSAYIFGFSKKDEENQAKNKPPYSPPRFRAFREKNLMVLGEINSINAHSVREFLKRYDISAIKENEFIKKNLDELMQNGGSFVFRVEGQPHYVHEDPAIKIAWEDYLQKDISNYMGQCLITGEFAPIAKLHKKIKGLGKMPIPLVSFDKDSTAYTSFNLEEGYNAPVSEIAAFKYKTALNYLLSRENLSPRIMLGKTYVVYWAESEKRAYVDTFAELWGAVKVNQNIDARVLSGVAEEEDNILYDQRGADILSRTAEKIRDIKPIDLDSLLAGLDENIKFYILGLEPVKGRIIVRFFHSEPFIKIAQRLVDHYKTLQLTNERGYPARPIRFWKILDEIVPHSIKDKNNRKDRIPPQLPATVMRAIFNGTPYPASLFQLIVNRVRTETDQPKTEREAEFDHVNYTRVSIIKACLLRTRFAKSQFLQKEGFLMALDEELMDYAYLLGRLFAVLENVQEIALPDLNVTIKDRYFGAACTSPKLVFPRIIKLSTYHLSKLAKEKKGYGIYLEKLIENINWMINPNKNPYPSQLSLSDQGMFILGYYHQRAKLFRKSAGVSAELANIQQVETQYENE